MRFTVAEHCWHFTCCVLLQGFIKISVWNIFAINEGIFLLAGVRIICELFVHCGGPAWWVEYDVDGDVVLQWCTVSLCIHCSSGVYKHTLDIHIEGICIFLNSVLTCRPMCSYCTVYTCSIYRDTSYYIHVYIYTHYNILRLWSTHASLHYLSANHCVFFDQVLVQKYHILIPAIGVNLSLQRNTRRWLIPEHTFMFLFGLWVTCT